MFGPYWNMFLVHDRHTMIMPSIN